MNRRDLLALMGFSAVLVFPGCKNPILDQDLSETESILEESEEATRLVGDLARTWGLKPAKVESVALVTQLSGTGSDPDPTSRRNVLIEDMKRHGVDNPNQWLASSNTALVIAQAILPPAVQENDRVDIDVRIPTRSKSTSLEDGWLMFTRLQEMQALGNQIRSGRVHALAQGDILTNSLVNGGVSVVSNTRGRILGGGVVTKSRSIGLALKEENHSFSVSRKIGDAINKRFHTYDRGIKRGAATPKRDNFIELAVQPQYRNNLMRYVRVVESIAVGESDGKRAERLGRLEQEMLDPKTSVFACLELEGIGDESVNVLLRGIRSPDQLVRFYSAEALAYLNHESAPRILAPAAENESSLRWRALTALSAMTNMASHDVLSNLLHSNSAETRYGAFQALQDANPRDPLIQGEKLGEVMALHSIPTHTESMIHIRKTKRPEIVIFGDDVQLATPLALSAGSRILVNGDGNKFKVTSFHSSETQVDYCSTQLSDVIRTIVAVGGSYSDVVSAIQDAKRQSALQARVRIDAIPRTGRKFNREDHQGHDDLKNSNTKKIDLTNVSHDLASKLLSLA